MILIDKPEENQLCFPPDLLPDSERVSRLFSGITERWRLLAILTVDAGPSNLVIPEVKKLVNRYGRSGLATRVILLSDGDDDAVLREARRWNGEDVVATGDNIHARRFLGTGSLPSIQLFRPDGTREMVITGFDTENGLDPIDGVLQNVMNPTKKSVNSKLAGKPHE